MRTENYYIFRNHLSNQIAEIKAQLKRNELTDYTFLTDEKILELELTLDKLKKARLKMGSDFNALRIDSVLLQAQITMDELSTSDNPFELSLKTFADKIILLSSLPEKKIIKKVKTRVSKKLDPYSVKFPKM
jgi:hypothetical protein